MELADVVETVDLANRDLKLGIYVWISGLKRAGPTARSDLAAANDVVSVRAVDVAGKQRRKVFPDLPSSSEISAIP
jgi:hypothetical protein